MHPLRVSPTRARTRICASSLLLLCLAVLFCASGAVVQVSNQKIFVDGTEYYVKGMVYEPTPLGIQGMNAQGYGGGGFCSAKLTPFDEWKSACYDYDFFDGSGSSPDRTPPGPDSWFSAIWSRDLPVLKDLGVNTIRLESLNPFTKAASEQGGEGVVHPYGKSHKEFFDACAQANIKVIAPLVSADPGVLMADDDSQWQAKVKNLVSELGTHPALLAWVVGSDWGLEDPTASVLTTKVNQVIEYAKQQGTNVPLTYCVSNLPQAAQFYADNLHIDFVCANAGWDGPQGITTFLGDSSDTASWASLSKQKGWPILIGETGSANLNASWTSEHPTWFNEVWQEVLDEDDRGVVGAIYFEYCDEPYSPQTWRRTLGATYLTVVVDGINNSTEENIFWADNVNEKEVLYDSIKQGQLNGTAINYNMDIYSYLQRQPQTTQTNPPPSGLSSSDASSLSLAADIVVAAVLVIYFTLKIIVMFLE